jgi:hypothetical protein
MAGNPRSLGPGEIVSRPTPEPQPPVPFSRSTLWREVKAGRFPAPCKLSPNTTAWRWGDVLEDLRARQGGEA